jgi:hypothetical protein
LLKWKILSNKYNKDQNQSKNTFEIG